MITLEKKINVFDILSPETVSALFSALSDANDELLAKHPMQELMSDAPMFEHLFTLLVAASNKYLSNERESEIFAPMLKVLLHDKIVFVPNVIREQFATYCEEHGIATSGGAFAIINDATGQYFYI